MILRFGYLGSEAFIERHSPRNRELKEIPRAQVRAVRPKLDRILKGSDDRGIVQAYKEHGYRLHEMGVHYPTVRRRLKTDGRTKRRCMIARPDSAGMDPAD